MNRLTERDRYGNARMSELKTYDLIGLDVQKLISARFLAGLCRAVDHLAAYEDTGLTLEEIEQLKAENARLYKLLGKMKGT